MDTRRISDWSRQALEPKPEPIKVKATKNVNVAVACTGSDGTPTFCFVTIQCSPEQYDNGDHYEAAKAHATEENYEGPDMVAFDQFDGPNWLFAQFPDDATIVSI